MADNTLQITPPFKFEIKTPPRGMTDYDPSAIHPQQQEELNTYKVNLMKENVLYMAKHPETKALYTWAANYFWLLKPWYALRKFGIKFTVPDKQFRREIRRVMNEDAFHIEDNLDESEGEDWDY